MSDSHIGSDLFTHEEEIINLLSSKNYDYIVLIGDILDVWEMKLSKIEERYKQIIDLIKSLGPKCIIVKGNHDPSFKKLAKMFPNNSVYEKKCEIVLDGKKFVFVHGDEFDWKSRFYGFLNKTFFKPVYLVGKIFGQDWRKWYRNKYYKDKQKRFSYTLLDKIELKTIEKYKKDADVLVAGHYHFAKIIEAKSGYYITTGCFIYPPTIVEYEDGKFKIVGE
jgi:UDP-2,3-diacylglucosamine pyrophosphatase LpxH